MAARYVDFETYRGRGYKMLLYADNREHMQVLHRLRKHLDYSQFYCGIWHIQYDDQTGREIVKGQGKKHAHIIIDLLNPVYWRSFCRSLGADPRFCMPVTADINDKGLFVVKAGSNVRRGLVYLTHVAYPEKDQYSVHDIFGAEDMKEKASAAVDAYLSRNLSMSDCAFYISEWISGQKDYITALDFMRWVCATPYFKAVSSPLVRAVWDEHNRQIMRQRERELSEQRQARERLAMVSGGCRSFDLSEFVDPIFDGDGGLIF